MKRRIRLLVPALLLSLLMPLLLAQVAAASPPETTDGFVCPVLGGEAGGDHGQSDPAKFVDIAEGDTTIIGPDVTVPTGATNQDGDGSPGGEHAAPGDENYSPIWP